MKRFVAVVFKPDMANVYGNVSPYTFFYDDDAPLFIGDTVVVDSAGSFQIAYVKSFPKSASNVSKWVIQKVDVQAHKERLVKERRITALKANLKDKVSKFKEEQVLTLLAETDSEAASMIKELESLEGS